ncbi:Bsp6I family type II restriction endonuclease [Clostridium tertium]|uniref:Bsp6I family type II restriction endonuclease n=1 Tax=Clostridium tertium TaxID=1559 RepID=UPI003568F391
MMNLDLVTVDKSRFYDAIKAYFLWKELDTIIRTSHTRGINIPETITETLLCYVSDFKLNKGSGGDAFDEENNRVIEVKATSNFDRDTSSFSPKEEFDALFFVRLDKRNDVMYFYDLEMNSSDLKLIKVNSTQTLGEQQQQGRRPRFSVIKFVIEEKGLEPYAKLDLRTKKIVNLKK